MWLQFRGSLTRQKANARSTREIGCTASCESPRFQILHMVYFVQNVQKYRRYKEFEIYVEISTGTTISQEMLKQTVNKNNIHVPVGVSQVSQLVVMILLINDCYVMSLVVIISRMNFVLYRNTPPPLEKESYIKNTKFISSPVSRRVFQFQKNQQQFNCLCLYLLPLVSKQPICLLLVQR